MKKPLLREYQKEGVRTIHEKFDGRALLADEQGLGKSIQSLEYCEKYHKGKIVLIICPSGLKSNWVNEIRMHYGHAATILGSQKPPKYINSALCRYYVINYDVMRYWVKFFRTKLKPEVLIIDEGQRIKNLRSAWTKAIIKLGEKVPKIIVLTGTPITNCTADLWPISHLLRPRLWPNFYRYCYKYCKIKRQFGGVKLYGGKNLKRLNRTARKFFLIRRLKKDVLKDLPDKFNSIQLIEIENRNDYLAAESEFKKYVVSTNGPKFSQADMLTKFNNLKFMVGVLKYAYIVEWLTNFLEQSTEKIIFFGWHKWLLKALHVEFPDSILINGETANKDRDRLITKFKAHNKTRILFGNIKAAGVGLNLTEANNVAFGELPWTSADVNQCIDRTHRIGQSRKVMAYFLIARDTIEESVCKAISIKQGVADGAIDGQVVNSFDLLDYLKKEILRTPKIKGAK